MMKLMNKKIWLLPLIFLAGPLQGMCCCKRDKDKYKPKNTGFYFVQKKPNKPEERMRARKQNHQATVYSRELMWKKKKVEHALKARNAELEKMKQLLEY